MNIIDGRLTRQNSQGIVMHYAALCGRMTRGMTSKCRVTVNLSDGEHAAFDQLANRLKVSKAWLGRQAISEMLERAQKDDAQLPLPLARRRERESR